MKSYSPKSLAGCAVLGALAGVVLGCGSESASPLVCGAGTVEAAGQCVPAPGSDASADAVSEQSTADGGADTSADAVTEDATVEQDADAGEPIDPTGACPKGLPGPKLIQVTTPGGQKYCVDATEVTSEQYKGFVDDVGETNMSGQPPECAGNKAWLAGPSCLLSSKTHPVKCVDWCDAYAYCKWAGKHLCGAIGGGALDENDWFNLEKSEWYGACSGGGKYLYPYGDTYDPDKCDAYHYGYDGGTPPSIPAGTMTECRGKEPPYDSILEMSGSKGEWIQACDNMGCAFVGEGVIESGPEYSCKALAKLDRMELQPTIGFRCCADTGL